MAEFERYVAQLDANFDLDVSGWVTGGRKHVHGIQRNKTGGNLDARTMLRTKGGYWILFFKKYSNPMKTYAELGYHTEPSSARIVEDLQAGRRGFNPKSKTFLHARPLSYYRQGTPTNGSTKHSPEPCITPCPPIRPSMLPVKP